MNRKQRRAVKKGESPFLDGGRVQTPNDAKEALIMIAYREKIAEDERTIIARLNNDEIDLYAESCRAWLAGDYAYLESIKKAYSENRAERLTHVDRLAHVLIEIRICKEFLSTHKPTADANGEIRYMQGRLF